MDKGDIALNFSVTPFAPEDYIKRNIIGFAPMQAMLEIQHSGLEAVKAGLDKTWVFAKMVIMTIKTIIAGRVSAKNIGGPILIAQASYKFAQLGIGKLIYFMALLSINLAIINLLPIPVLDGGHLVFVAIEKIRGKPLSDKVMGIANMIGLFLLFALIIFVIFNDISRIING